MEKDLSSQAKSDDKNKMKVCQICKKQTATSNLSKHLKTHLAKGDRVKFKCSVEQCSKEYFNAGHLKLHVKQCHSGPIKRYGCNLCQSTFASTNGRDYHIVAAHTGERSFKCKECPSKFASNSALLNHLLVHTEARPNKCEICSKSYKRHRDLATHVQRIHSQKTKDFQCSTCQKTFFAKSDLRKHSRIHSLEVGQYCCYFCPKSFRNRTKQESHLRIHTQEKPYFCLEDSCNYSSSNSSDLKRHKNSHHPQIGGEAIPHKTYPCYFCSKSCSHSSHLEMHTRIHTLESPFTCSLCPKSFTSNGNLQKHIFTHAKEKAFKCTHCQKCFSRITILKGHIRFVHLREKRFHRKCHMQTHQ